MENENVHSESQKHRRTNPVQTNAHAVYGDPVKVESESKKEVESDDQTDV